MDKHGTVAKNFGKAVEQYNTSVLLGSQQLPRMEIQGEKLEAGYDGTADYQAYSDMGELQAEFLKLADYMEEWNGDIRRYNVCRRKTQ